MPGSFLGIETSGPATAAAVLTHGEVVAAACEPGTAHNELLFPLLLRVLRVAGVNPAGLAGIGVTIGPGMFSSLRVGLAAAKALALAHAVPLAGIDAFLALAASVNAADGPVLAVIDARKEQVYAALCGRAGVAFGPALLTPAALAARVAALGNCQLPSGGTGGSGEVGRVVLAGSGAGLCREELDKAGVGVIESGVAGPCAAEVARLARTRIGAGRADEVRRLEPLYIRRTDAELARGRAAGG